MWTCGHGQPPGCIAGPNLSRAWKVGDGEDEVLVSVVATLDRSHRSLREQPGDPGGSLA